MGRKIHTPRRPGRIGRNDPCPCGSGTKFKKCCLNKVFEQPEQVRTTASRVPPKVFAKARQMIREREIQQREHLARYGHVRQQVTTPAFGKRMVTVKNKIFLEDWRFFSDFLRDYVPYVFGDDWCKAEMTRPEAERHPVTKWRTQGAIYMNAQPAQPDGSRVAPPSGAISAYMCFAYDLFVVDDNGELDDALIERLKIREQFQGARHELFAQATCLRAGFTVQHENEKDGSRRHAEFTATHKATGQMLSIEAKSRHRSGVLAVPGRRAEKPDLRFGALINDAVSKKPQHPFVIFIDTNMPFKWADRFYPVRGGEIQDGWMHALLERTKTTHNNLDPYCMIVFSNHPHHYASDELDPQKHLFSVVSQDVQADLAALRSLHDAANLYGNIPYEFPDQEGKSPAVVPVFKRAHTIRYDFSVNGSEVKVTRNDEAIAATFLVTDKDRPQAPSALHEFLEDIGRSRVDAHMVCEAIERGQSVHAVMGNK